MLSQIAVLALKMETDNDISYLRPLLIRMLVGATAEVWNTDPVFDLLGCCDSRDTHIRYEDERSSCRM